MGTTASRDRRRRHVDPDVTPTRDQTGPARLLDTVAGRSAAALTMWLASRPPAFRDQVDVVAMDGFGCYKTAAAEVLPQAATVMDPFHVVALAGAKLDLTRQRIQQQTCGHRGRSGDPLYGVRRTLRTRLPCSATANELDSKRSTNDAHLAVQVTWSVYQRIIAAYHHPDRRRGKTMMTAIIESLRRGVPAVLEELAQLGRTLWHRRTDILAFFDHHASNGPTEAISGRLEALRRNALAFRNLTHYRWRSLLHSGASTHSSTHSKLRRACVGHATPACPPAKRRWTIRSLRQKLDSSATGAKAKEFQPSSQTGRVADRIAYRGGDPAVLGSLALANRRTR